MGSNLSRIQRWTKLWKGRMTAHSRLEITIETDQILILRQGRPVRAYCSECACEVDVLSEEDMLDREEADALAGVTGQALRDSAQTLGGHLAQGQDGSTLICLQSLRKARKWAQIQKMTTPINEK